MDTTNNSGQTPEVVTNPSDSATKEGPVKNTTMALISYIGPLVIIAYAIAKDDSFVKFHIRQGFVLFTIEVALWFLGMVLPIVLGLVGLAQIGVLILAIIGVVNALGEKEKELPLVGKYASHFKI